MGELALLSLQTLPPRHRSLPVFPFLLCFHKSHFSVGGQAWNSPQHGKKSDGRRQVSEGYWQKGGKAVRGSTLSVVLSEEHDTSCHLMSSHNDTLDGGVSWSGSWCPRTRHLKAFRKKQIQLHVVRQIDSVLSVWFSYFESSLKSANKKSHNKTLT